jgi:hypothetical protein
MLWFLCASGPTTLQLPQFATLGEERVDLSDQLFLLASPRPHEKSSQHTDHRQGDCQRHIPEHVVHLVEVAWRQV